MTEPGSKLETADERDQREAGVLAGELVVTLSSGRKVTIRELTWRQGRRHMAELQPLVAMVAARSVSGTLDVEAYFDIPEQFPEVIEEMLKVTAGLTEAELESLGDQDGRALAAGFLSLHTPFFAPRVGREVRRLARAEGRLPETSTLGDQESSSPPSSDGGTTP